MTLSVQLISTDFDGTLLTDQERPGVPVALQALLAELQGQGASWVINTGRDLSGVLEGLAQAGVAVKPDYLVTVERLIHRRENGHYVGLAHWNDRCHAEHERLFARVLQDRKRLGVWINARFNAMVYEDPYSPLCVIARTNPDMDQIQAFLDEYCGEVPGLTTVRNDVYVRFSHVDFNKGTAMAEIARLLGIPRARVFAAGDHLNDLPMLSSAVAGWLLAPANAIPGVKEAVLRQGGLVSPESWGHGVAWGLRQCLALRLPDD
jgi:hydroxymethylpyrimidine pyrophosphatase-like HAD family hydrolase